MPSFNTLELDLDSMKPKNFRVTSVDITTAYGMISYPTIDDVKWHTMDYNYFGFNDLSANGIANGLLNLRQQGIT